MQEMDLNVYEDDDDETLHRKLIAAKIARKRAEEDHKLLANRISLLRQEEQKVLILTSLTPFIGLEEDRWNKEASHWHNEAETEELGAHAIEDGQIEIKGGRGEYEIGTE